MSVLLRVGVLEKWFGGVGGQLDETIGLLETAAEIGIPLDRDLQMVWQTAHVNKQIALEEAGGEDAPTEVEAEALPAE